MTSNKSQGQTLIQVSIHLPRPCFTYGQLYVALSRAKKSKDVCVLTANATNQSANVFKSSVAMTINKSQGQTLSQVSIHLPRSCFTHGQLYVALSRAKKSKDVCVFTTNATNRSANVVKSSVAQGSDEASDLHQNNSNLRCEADIAIINV
ncbi:uncharacterized protein LOC110734708 [Chenopodium quinoa]|uniref:uncharacterized protein LOC110734708 n=1 Tax=Chenopodium quinoa TaxID=63459 RepID=UPI000B76EE3C|nr:uncharacterized protein LOC110734708 [Chenopodium quinoa]